MQIDDVRQRIGPAFFGPYPELPNSALALPIIPPGADSPIAIFIAGVSSRLTMNEAYRSFYDLLASSVTTAVANARAYDDERRRAKALVTLDASRSEKLRYASFIGKRELTPAMKMAAGWSAPGGMIGSASAVFGDSG